MNKYIFKLDSFELFAEFAARFCTYEYQSITRKVGDDGENYCIVETNESIDQVEHHLHEMVDTKVARGTLVPFIPPPVKVLVDFSNGMFETVHSDAPVIVMAVDYDDSENTRATILGKEAWAGVIMGECDPSRVAKAFQDWDNNQPFLVPRSEGMGSHQSAKMGKDEWLTPPHILEAFPTFDLDPCAPRLRPWETAHNHYSLPEDGLSLPWFDRVWLNPPYGKETEKWLTKLANHGNGIALIFARTETDMFFEQVWCRAKSVFFIKGRLYFHHVTGERARYNGGAPSVLIAYGEECDKLLKDYPTEGQYIKLR